MKTQHWQKVHLNASNVALKWTNGEVLLFVSSSGHFGHEGGAERKLTFVSGIHTSLFTLFPVMLPSYISLEDTTELQLNHVRLASAYLCVADVCQSVPV